MLCNNKMINFLLVLLFFYPFITFISALNAEVKLDLPNGGFHRTLKYDINIKNFEMNNCHVALYFEFPSSFYVNVDEISKLVRRGQLTACSIGEFNVELFAENAGTQNVTVCSRLIGSNVILTLPLHQRYHEPREGGGYIEIKLPKPKLLIGCEERIKEHRVSKVELCSPCSELVDKWREISYNL
ncbi:phosphatidylinositol-glycan biosynthesis class X protein, partial [Leptopilina boulardi]|uniref:phosphatidylinositol-glycan biosynthesis class X protein n=1 Tax=Leptopilina boulardi TaxID=63433 RepID=UPI0021F52905